MPDLPQEYNLCGVPVHHEGEDCMGGAVDYWSDSVKDENGNLIIGYGRSAELDLVSKCIEDKRFRKLEPKERMEEIIDKMKKRVPMKIYDNELVTICLHY